MRTFTKEERIAELQPLTLMDDLYMRIFFADNIPCAQIMLRVILDKPNLIVKSVKVQYVLRGGNDSKYVRLDVWAEDEDGTQYDTEFQNASSGASAYRARYNSAILDANILKPKEDYSLLKKRESVVIFITDKDVLGEGEPIYFIDRVILKSGKKFNDGSHIVYVDSSHKDLTTALGRLMHDLRCVKPDDMLDSVFAEKAEATKGDGGMGVWEEMEREAEARGRALGVEEGRALGVEEGRALGVEEGKAINSENIALGLLRIGKDTLDEITAVCGLPRQRVEDLARTMQ